MHRRGGWSFAGHIPYKEVAMHAECFKNQPIANEDSHSRGYSAYSTKALENFWSFPVVGQLNECETGH